MKVTIFVLVFFVFNALASESYAQRVTLKAEKVTLKRLFSEIEKQTGYTVFYKSADISNKSAFTVNVENAALNELLDRSLVPQSLTYTIDGNTVVISRAPEAIQQTLDTVRGVVVDQDRRPILGASVRIKGTSTGVVTASDGSFLLRHVPPGETVEITHIGYTQVSRKAVADFGMIILSVQVDVLDEVALTINTGYQRISKERSAGSYAKPDMKVFQDRTFSTNVLRRLDGLIPGLTINQSPSAAANPLLIRGLTSLNARRAPLFVVDGMPMDNIDDLNANDIEDISVLKDATAASIWGARGANGVIVLSTKGGKPNEAFSLSYNAYANIQGKPQLDYFPVLNSKEFITAAEEIFDPVTNNWNTLRAQINGRIAPHEAILYNRYSGVINEATKRRQLDSLAALDNTDQIRELWYRNAMVYNQTLSAKGGTENYGFYGSFTYANHVDATPDNQNKNYKLNVRQDYKWKDRLKVHLITDLNSNTTRTMGTNRPDNRFTPYALFQDDQGHNLPMSWLMRSDSLRTVYEQKSLISLAFNPLDDVKHQYTNAERWYARLNGGIQLKLWDGLRFESTYGVYRSSQESISMQEQDAYNTRSEVVNFTVAATTPTGLPVYHLPKTGSKRTTRNFRESHWTFRNQLVFDRDWQDGTHQLVALAGTEAQQHSAWSTSGTVRGYNDKLMTYVILDYNRLSSAAGGVDNPVMPNSFSRSTLVADMFEETESIYRYLSYYGNAGYTYQKKYTVNASLRADESNLFGKDRSAQNRPVWSVGLSWNIGNEAFMQDGGILDRLILRATHGLAGNSPNIGAAASYDILIASRNTVFPGGDGMTIGTPGNTKLSWESTKATNIGVDFHLFSHRLRGSVDAYRKMTENLIGIMPVNAFTGYANIPGNFGSLLNKGLELSLSASLLRQGAWSWDMGLNVAVNQNKITDLNLTAPIATGNALVTQQYHISYPAYALFAYQYAGLDAMGDPQIMLADQSVTKARNVAKPEDILFMGTTQPPWSGGLQQLLSYANVSLSLNTVFSLGHVIRRDVNQLWAGGRLSSWEGQGYFNSGNVHSEFSDRWKNPGDENLTDIPAYVATSSINTSRRDVNYYKLADANVMSGSFVKIRDLSLAYQLPSQLAERIWTKDLRLRVQWSNIMLWKANKYGVDPEFWGNGHTDGGTRSVPVNQRTLSLGIDVKF